MDDDSDRVEVSIWYNKETNQIGKIVVPYMTDEQVELFFEDIEDYFYRQGGEMRQCKYCGRLYPFFALGLNFDYCLNGECFIKHNEERNRPRSEILERLKRQAEGPQQVKVKERRPPKPKSEEPRGERPGYVYLMRAENGLHKIGRAKNYETRRQGLERDIPMKVMVVHVIVCSDYIRAEARLHERYSAYRVGYEWFSLSPEQVAEITGIGNYELD